MGMLSQNTLALDYELLLNWNIDFINFIFLTSNPIENAIS
jgi:hypothetical protein